MNASGSPEAAAYRECDEYHDGESIAPPCRLAGLHQTIILDHHPFMPTGADLGPDLAPSTCHVCGQPAGLEYWVDERRWPVHTKCRDWKKLPFVFARQLKALGRRRGEPGVGEVLAWLEAARRRWPEGAVETVEAGQERLRRIGVW